MGTAGVRPFDSEDMEARLNGGACTTDGRCGGKSDPHPPVDVAS
jgi:hypothetical protein